MRGPFSEYMEWAKTRSGARFNLASSGLLAFPLAELGAELEDLEICGDSAYGYVPLQERLARKAGVSPDRVVHATGTSMANLLALAATADAGDEVLIEDPTYTLLTDAARWLRLEVRRFPRRAEDGFRLDPGEVEKALTPRTRLVVITNLHNRLHLLRMRGGERIILQVRKKNSLNALATDGNRRHDDIQPAQEG